MILGAIATFQSTRPHGARLRIAHDGPAVAVVSIHAPARGATAASQARPITTGRFNPRARTGRDRIIRIGLASLPMFQSTRPHGARPCAARSSSNAGTVSIHAPARGATDAILLTPIADHVSIHAPARGATPWCTSTTSPARCFNPRARTGRDSPLLPIDGVALVFQSTRPHGARRSPHTERSGLCSFNPRARTGRDRGTSNRSHSPVMFQSTRPHGARRDVAQHCGDIHHRFNPRARTGRDFFVGPGTDAGPEFQSTRPHGARPPWQRRR